MSAGENRVRQRGCKKPFRRRDARTRNGKRVTGVDLSHVKITRGGGGG